MADLHRIVADVGLALAALALAWSVGLLVTRRSPGRLFVVNLAWTGIVIGATSLAGLLLLATSSGPHDPLHLVYGALGIVAVPVAIAVGSRRPVGQQAGIMLVATIVLLILVLRLFQTG